MNLEGKRAEGDRREQEEGKGKDKTTATSDLGMINGARIEGEAVATNNNNDCDKERTYS